MPILYLGYCMHYKVLKMAFKTLHNLASHVVFISFPVITSVSSLVSLSRLWAWSYKKHTHNSPNVMFVSLPMLLPLGPRQGSPPPPPSVHRLAQKFWDLYAAISGCVCQARQLPEAKDSIQHPWGLSLINTEQEIGKYLLNEPWSFGKTLFLSSIYLCYWWTFSHNFCFGWWWHPLKVLG